MKRAYPGYGILALFICMVFMFSGMSWAVPQIINFQGSISDSEGNALDGDYEMEFYLFTDSQDGDTGSATWSETQTVHVTNGVYNILLGSSNPLTKDIFLANELYLEVWVENEKLVPRQRIASAPYAIKAEDANSAHMAAAVEEGAITTDMVNDGAITSAKIADGSVSSADIA